MKSDPVFNSCVKTARGWYLIYLIVLLGRKIWNVLRIHCSNVAFRLISVCLQYVLCFQCLSVKEKCQYKMKAKKWIGLQIWLDLTMSEREKQYPSTNCGQKHKRNWYVCKSISAGLTISETELTQMPSSKEKENDKLQHKIILLATKMKNCLNLFPIYF